MSWLGNRLKSFGNNIGSAISSAGDAVGKAWNGTTEALGDARDWAIDKTADAMLSVKDAAVAVYDDPGLILDGIEDAYDWTVDKTADGMIAVKDAAIFTVNNPLEAAKIAGKTYIRTQALIAQGLTNAAASTVGMVGDLGVIGGKLVIGVVNIPVRTANMFYSEEEQMDLALGRPKWMEDFSASDYLVDHVNFLEALDIEPENGWEKGLLYGSQAVGEVGAFIVMTVGTGGVGGVAIAAGRGGRIANLALKAEKIALKGERLFGTAEMAAKTAGTLGKAERAAKALNGSRTTLTKLHNLEEAFKISGDAKRAAKIAKRITKTEKAIRKAEYATKSGERGVRFLRKTGQDSERLAQYFNHGVGEKLRNLTEKAKELRQLETKLTATGDTVNAAKTARKAANVERKIAKTEKAIDGRLNKALNAGNKRMASAFAKVNRGVARITPKGGRTEEIVGRGMRAANKAFASVANPFENGFSLAAEIGGGVMSYKFNAAGEAAETNLERNGAKAAAGVLGNILANATNANKLELKSQRLNNEFYAMLGENPSPTSAGSAFAKASSPTHGGNLKFSNFSPKDFSTQGTGKFAIKGAPTDPTFTYYTIEELDGPHYTAA